MTDIPNKKDLRAADQDTAAEIAFAAGKLPEEDRRKPVVPTPAIFLPAQGRVISPPAPSALQRAEAQVEGPNLAKYLGIAVTVVVVLVVVGVCRA